MKKENVYKIVKNGSLVKVKDRFGVVISSAFNYHNIDITTHDPCVYRVNCDGCEMLLIREAFDIVQEP